MKQTLFIILLFPAFLFAQDVTRDTYYITTSGSNFFETHRIEYSTGAYSETSTLIGDTTSMLSVYVNKIASEAQQQAIAGQTAYRMRQKTTEWAKLDTITTARLLRSPITAIADSYEREFLTGSWEIQFSNTTTAVTFPRLSTNKRIRLLPSGSTAKTMLIYGPVIRLVNYPFTGLNTLFQLKEGYWINLEYGDATKRVVLRRL